MGQEIGAAYFLLLICHIVCLELAVLPVGLYNSVFCPLTSSTVFPVNPSEGHF